jgi:formylglycine-generating enzyme required for sulfatase activity
VLLAGLAQAEAPLIDLPAGEVVMGRDVGGRPDEHPAHRVKLSAFRLEATLVTVADFRQFVEATRYVTSAEKLGYGVTSHEGMKEWQWEQTPGATWRNAFGALPIADDLPVTLVSWVDANAYCAWKHRRLPTEAEWEYAMRAGSTSRFPWGDAPLAPDGGVRLNAWQGKHVKSESTDGYLYASPVRAFPPNAWGFYDPVGNLWQWTADWYAEDTYGRAGARAVDPTGPESGTLRVARGGSWWCSKQTCSAYGLYSRGKTKPEAPFNNNGFRCAQSLPK